MTTRTGSAYLAQLQVRATLTKGAKKRRRKKRIRVRPLKQPDAIRRKYAKAIKSEVLGVAIALVRSTLFEGEGEALVRESAAARTDEALAALAPPCGVCGAAGLEPCRNPATGGERGEHISRVRLDTASRAAQVMRKMADDFFAEFGPEKLRPVASAIARETNAMHKREMAAQIKAAIAIDVPFRDPTILALVEDFTAENVALIRTIPARMFDDVESTLLRDLRKGLRWEEIAPEIEDRFSVSESRAELIARDQVGKFYGDLNATRQADLGVTRFVWRTARDNRVRAEHMEREGKSYEWSDPPEGEIPGDPINCRCQGEPDLAPLLEAMKGES